ncbi:MAG: KdsC family phosphatase [Azovibrio sp.]
MSTKNPAAQLKLMAFDIDGVMTDGSLYFTEEGKEFKAFNTLDGHGLRMLQKAGVVLAIITGRTSGAVAARAANLGISYLYQGVEDKKACLNGLLQKLQIPWEAAGYMGDDVVDLPIMQACGFCICPANSHNTVKQHAQVTTLACGGKGAVREACDLILAAQGREDIFLTPYLQSLPRKSP